MGPQLRLLISFILIVPTLTNDHVLSVDENRYACNSSTSQEQPPNRVNTEKQLAALRRVMNGISNGNDTIDAYFVTSDDEHQSEFVASYNRRLQYISGFSGSNGHAIITKTKAVFWTDGRYHTQADEELDCNWILMRAGNPKVPTLSAWLLSEFPEGAKIVADAKIIPAKRWMDLEFALKESNSNFKLTKTTINLIDLIWANRPDNTISEGFVLGDKFTGRTWLEKVDDVRAELKDLHSDGLIITALDEVAWVLNIRGRDDLFSNLLDVYAIITLTNVTLYVNPIKIKNNISTYFENYPLMKFRNYEDFWNDLSLLVEESKKIVVPSPCVFNKGASKEIFDLIPKEKRLFVPSPIIKLKAEKNSVERLGMNKAHIRDSAALCRFLHFFETNFHSSKKEVWDELRVAEYVNIFRSKQELFLGISFSTIVGFGPHGALPHYVPTNLTSSLIGHSSTIVIDSGGQYYDGTTDVTRTIHMGVPEPKHKEAYTRVLKGSIQLSQLVFPEDLRGENLDVLARSPLWEIGYDYPHGTGHGIGASLNVHESPISINYKNLDSSLLKPGYYFSNEPGCYIIGDFGIRLENIMEVVNVIEKNSIWFYGFNVVTLVPYEMKLIDLSLLDKSHIRWLNNYNSRIRTLVGEELIKQNATDAYNWVIKNTEVINLH